MKPGKPGHCTLTKDNVLKYFMLKYNAYAETDAHGEMRIVAQPTDIKRLLDDFMQLEEKYRGDNVESLDVVKEQARILGILR